jgi:hypothetical protein
MSTLAPTTTELTSSPNPSTYGQTVQLTATIVSSAPGGATGTVTFRNGSNTLGSANVNSGTAVLNTSTLPAGVPSIDATYNGDGRNAKSTSAPVSQTVNAAVTTTTLISSPNPSVVGQTVKFTATVSSPTTVPTGSVTFMDGSTALSTVTLARGKASYSTSTLAKGFHSITAVYSGNANVAGSTSSVLTQTVN